MKENKYSFIAGGYTDRVTKNGIYFLELDENGKGRVMEKWEHLYNPSFLEYDRKNQRLFVANEVESNCKIDVYQVERKKLKYERSIKLKGRGLCHLRYNDKNKKIYGSCYGSGSFHCVDDNLNQFHGEVYPKRSTHKAHAHCCSLSHDGRWLITTDLGLSCLEVYDLCLDVPFPAQLQQSVKLKRGLGPREVKWNQAGNRMYVVNELGNTVGVYAFDNKGGKIIEELAQVKTSFLERRIKNYPASCIVTNNGKWMLLSNRGYNTISLFKIEEDGIPTLYKEYSCFGDWPRYIMLTKDEKYFLVANQRSSEICVFRFEKEKNKLCFVQRIPVENVSCIIEV
ncbi:MAG: lactonase family protein [Epulopiscium sp.]|nr:lactonase family protein [Candidatus Epulonipiscium sp.]